MIVYNKTYQSNRKENILTKKAKDNKTVFMAFDCKLPNYSNVSNKEIMFHVNLDEEELITKENVISLSQRHTR